MTSDPVVDHSRLTLTVVLVSYNTSEQTVRCLESVLDSTPELHEIIVVDNGSVDDTVDAVRALSSPRLRVLATGANLGFSKAANLGVADATGEYVVLLNPDTIVKDGALSNLVQFARKNPKHGVYGGRTVRSNGVLDPHSCWGRPTLWSTFCFATGLSTAFPSSSLFDPESLGPWKRDSVREVDVVTGCLLLVPRDTYLKIGGMDERFFLYGEDVEFSLRAIDHGLQPVIVPSAEIVHDSGGSSAATGGKMSMVMAGKVTLFNVLWSTSAASIGRSLLVVGTALRAALESVLRRPSRQWRDTWQRRAQWLPGYPDARDRIFGSPHSGL